MGKRRGEYPMSKKSEQQRRKENRSRGRGIYYEAFHKANESRSSGESSIIFDPIAGRQVHTLSRGETDCFWLLRWRDDVNEIREQYEIPLNEINDLKRELNDELGRKVFHPTNDAMTTDFLVDFKDGRQIAISLKGESEVFAESKSECQREEYEKLIRRIYVEKVYWERRGVAFFLVTSDRLNHTLSSNIQLVMHYYNPIWVTTREHKLMYLIARKIIPINFEDEKFDVRRYIEKIDLDIDAIYEKARNYYG